jgi:hypothetical protein
MKVMNNNWTFLASPALSEMKAHSFLVHPCACNQMLVRSHPLQADVPSTAASPQCPYMFLRLTVLYSALWAFLLWNCKAPLSSTAFKHAINWLIFVMIGGPSTSTAAGLSWENYLNADNELSFSMFCVCFCPGYPSPRTADDIWSFPGWWTLLKKSVQSYSCVSLW